MMTSWKQRSLQSTVFCELKQEVSVAFLKPVSIYMNSSNSLH